MYGTIARLKVKEGALEELRRMETSRTPEGFVGTFVFQSDQSADELWLVAIFNNKLNYFANAGSAEQDQDYQKLRQQLKADPEWHDGEIVFASEQLQQPC